MSSATRIWRWYDLASVLFCLLYVVNGELDTTGNKTDEICPCLPMDECPRIYGQSATDIRQLGFLEPCREFGTVRCCGVTIRIAHNTDSDINSLDKMGGRSWDENLDLDALEQVNSQIKMRLVRRPLNPAFNDFQADSTNEKLFPGTSKVRGQRQGIKIVQVYPEGKSPASSELQSREHKASSLTSMTPVNDGTRPVFKKTGRPTSEHAEISADSKNTSTEEQITLPEESKGASPDTSPNGNLTLKSHLGESSSVMSTTADASGHEVQHTKGESSIHKIQNSKAENQTSLSESELATKEGKRNDSSEHFEKTQTLQPAASTGTMDITFEVKDLPASTGTNSTGAGRSRVSRTNDKDHSSMLEKRDTSFRREMLPTSGGNAVHKVLSVSSGSGIRKDFSMHAENNIADDKKIGEVSGSGMTDVSMKSQSGSIVEIPPTFGTNVATGSATNSNSNIGNDGGFSAKAGSGSISSIGNIAARRKFSSISRGQKIASNSDSTVHGKFSANSGSGITTSSSTKSNSNIVDSGGFSATLGSGSTNSGGNMAAHVEFPGNAGNIAKTSFSSSLGNAVTVAGQKKFSESSGTGVRTDTLSNSNGDVSPHGTLTATSGSDSTSEIGNVVIHEKFSASSGTGSTNAGGSVVARRKFLGRTRQGLVDKNSASSVHKELSATSGTGITPDLTFSSTGVTDNSGVSVTSGSSSPRRKFSGARRGGGPKIFEKNSITTIQNEFSSNSGSGIATDSSKNSAASVSGMTTSGTNIGSQQQFSATPGSDTETTLGNNAGGQNGVTSISTGGVVEKFGTTNSGNIGHADFSAVSGAGVTSDLSTNSGSNVSHRNGFSAISGAGVTKNFATHTGNTDQKEFSAISRGGLTKQFGTHIDSGAQNEFSAIPENAVVTGFSVTSDSNTSPQGFSAISGDGVATNFSTQPASNNAGHRGFAAISRGGVTKKFVTKSGFRKKFPAISETEVAKDFPTVSSATSTPTHFTITGASSHGSSNEISTFSEAKVTPGKLDHQDVSSATNGSDITSHNGISPITSISNAQVSENNNFFKQTEEMNAVRAPFKFQRPRKRPFQSKSSIKVSTSEESRLTGPGSTEPIRIESVAAPASKIRRKFRVRPVTTSTTETTPIEQEVIPNAPSVMHPQPGNFQEERVQFETFPPENVAFNAISGSQSQSQVKTASHFENSNRVPQVQTDKKKVSHFHVMHTVSTTEQPQPIAVQIDTFGTQQPEELKRNFSVISSQPWIPQGSSRPEHVSMIFSQEVIPPKESSNESKSVQKNNQESSSPENQQPTPSYELFHNASKQRPLHKFHKQRLNPGIAKNAGSAEVDEVVQTTKTTTSIRQRFPVRGPSSAEIDVDQPFSPLRANDPARNYIHQRINPIRKLNKESDSEEMTTTTVRSTLRKYVDRLKPSRGPYGGHETEEKSVSSTTTTSAPRRKTVIRLKSIKNSNVNQVETEDQSIATVDRVREEAKRPQPSGIYYEKYDTEAGSTVTTTRAPRRRIHHRIRPVMDSSTFGPISIAEEQVIPTTSAPTQQYPHQLHSNYDREKYAEEEPTTTRSSRRKYIQRVRPAKDYSTSEETTTTHAPRRRFGPKLTSDTARPTAEAFADVTSQNIPTTSAPVHEYTRFNPSKGYSSHHREQHVTEEQSTTQVPRRKHVQRPHFTRVQSSFEPEAPEYVTSTTTSAPLFENQQRLNPSRIYSNYNEDQTEQPTTAYIPKRQYSQRPNSEPIHTEYEATYASVYQMPSTTTTAVPLEYVPVHGHSSYNAAVYSEDITTQPPPEIQWTHEPINPNDYESSIGTDEELVQTTAVPMRRDQDHSLNSVTRYSIVHTESTAENEPITLGEKINTAHYSTPLTTTYAEPETVSITTTTSAPTVESIQSYNAAAGVYRRRHGGTRRQPEPTTPTTSAPTQDYVQPRRQYSNRGKSTYRETETETAKPTVAPRPSYPRRKSLLVSKENDAQTSITFSAKPNAEVPGTSAPASRRFKLPIRFNTKIEPISSITEASITTTSKPYSANIAEKDSETGSLDNYDLILDKEVRDHLASGLPMLTVHPVHHATNIRFDQSYDNTNPISYEDDDRKETFEEESRVHVKFLENTTTTPASTTASFIDNVNKQERPKYKRVRVENRPTAVPSGSTSSSSHVNSNIRTSIVKSQVPDSKEQPEHQVPALPQSKSASKRFKVQLSPLSPPSSTPPPSPVQATRFNFPPFKTLPHALPSIKTPLTKTEFKSSVPNPQLNFKIPTEPAWFSPTTEPPVNHVQTTEASYMSLQLQPTQPPTASTTPMTAPTPSAPTQTLNLAGFLQESKFQPRPQANSHKTGRFPVPTTFNFSGAGNHRGEELNAFDSPGNSGTEISPDKENEGSSNLKGIPGSWNEGNAGVFSVNTEVKESWPTFPETEMNPLRHLSVKHNLQNSNQNSNTDAKTPASIGSTQFQDGNDESRSNQELESNSNKLGNPTLSAHTTPTPLQTSVHQTPDLTYVNIVNPSPNGLQPHPIIPSSNGFDNKPNRSTEFSSSTKNSGFQPIPSNEFQSSMLLSSPQQPTQFTRFESPSHMPSSIPAQFQTQFPSRPPLPAEQQSKAPFHSGTSNRFPVPPTLQAQGSRAPGISGSRGIPGFMEQGGRIHPVTIHTQVMTPVEANSRPAEGRPVANSPLNIRPHNVPGPFRPPVGLPAQHPSAQGHVVTQYSSNQFNPYGHLGAPIQFHTKTSPQYVKEFHQHHSIAQEILNKLQNSVRTSRSANLTDEEIASLLKLSSENASSTPLDPNSEQILKDLKILSPLIQELQLEGNSTEKSRMEPVGLETDQKKVADESPSSPLHDVVKDAEALGQNESGKFRAPEAIQRGFIPILPYSEKDPGLTVVNLNSNTRASPTLR